MTGRYLSSDDKQQLCRELLKIPAVTDRDKLNMYVAELETDIGQPLGANRQNDAQHDLYAILGAAEGHPGGLRRFIAIIRGFHEGNRAVAQVDNLLSTLEQQPLLQAEQRTSLVQMLQEAPSTRVRGALTVIASSAEHSTHNEQGRASDPLGLVRHLEMGAPIASRPPLLLFVDRLAHDSPPMTSKSLHSWIDDVGSALGMSQDDIRGLCRQTIGAKSGDAEVSRKGVSPRTRHQDPAAGDNKSVISGNDSSSHGASVPTSQYTREQPATDLPIAAGDQIRGDVPIRNQDFTGREALLNGSPDRCWIRRSKASVLPAALHGLGGVGKTQLAVEYVYRYGDQYDLIWWIPAEQLSLVLTSLATLCRRSRPAASPRTGSRPPSTVLRGAQHQRVPMAAGLRQRRRP